MKVAITGAGGMLGQALQGAFRLHDLTCWRHSQLDIEDAEAVQSDVRAGGFDWLLNAAAYTAVNQAEREREQAFAANAEGCRNLAVACNAAGCRLLSVSTDYVFDGEAGRAYREDDTPNPINVYGESKWAGEELIRQYCPRHLIVRTSWLYGAGGKHFVDTMLALAQRKPQIDVVADQRGSPTWTEDLAHMILRLVEEGCLGTYHVTNSGHCSRYEMVREIVACKGLETTVTAVTTEEFERKYPPGEGRQRVDRPPYSVLDNAGLRRLGWEPLRSWKKALRAYLGEKT
ncbi:MAG TPA: dTDP-4-dehydrorhamnose reductase [Acidobacteriota bacterium]|nr:dTDP-4-dehydrorhamnose reductase [Acidobacteriota bacterium]